MSSHKKGEADVNDGAVIRQVLPRHTVKRLALIMSVPAETARHWIYRHLSAARRRELALALLAELDEQDKLRALAREHLRKIAGE